jgi:alanine racemase
MTNYSPPPRPTWAEVNLRNLRHNYQALRKFLPPAVRIIAVIKANAYGHGAPAVARCLEECGVDYLAVAFLEEALELREAGIIKPILLLNGFWEGQEDLVLHHNLVPVVFNLAEVRRLSRAASRLRRQARCQVKIDTGMIRLGVGWEKAKDFFAHLQEEKYIICEGVLTHLTSAEKAHDPWAVEQIQRAQQLFDSLSQCGTLIPWAHIVNSAGIVNYPEAWRNAVRPGLMLYGVNPLDSPYPVELKPVLSLKSKVMHLNKIEKGTTIGYGRTRQVDRQSLVATLPIGYADGLNRLLSNQGSVLVRGQRAPIAGRISMDLTTIDVTGVPGVQIGDEVVFIGKQENDEIPATEMARLVGSIPYEVLCRIGSRVPRIMRDVG